MRQKILQKCKKQISFMMATVMVMMGCSVTPLNKVKAETVKQTKVVASYDFEGEDTEGWGPRGDESAELTSAVSHSGKQAVKVTDRVETWNGVSCDVTDLLEDGKSYTVKIWVMFDNNSYGNQQSMTLSFATTIDGTEYYNNLTSANVYCGNWTLFEGNFTYSADTEKVQVYMEGGTHDFYIDDVTLETEVYSEDIGTYDFESSLSGWEPRNEESVAVSDAESYTGSSSAFVSGRTESWEGIQKDVTSLLEDGETYTVKMYVMYNDESADSAVDMSLSAATTVDGTESYANLKNQSVKKGVWTPFEGSFTFSSGMEKAKLYIEGGTQDFYVDNISISKNKAADIQEDLPSLKDLFAQYNCRIGTSIVMNEFNAAEKAIIKKHFNSLTIGNEMKPDSVLNYDATVAYMEETGDQTTPQISFSKASPMLKYCEANGIEIRGHVLAWHSQTPKWFFTENYSQEQGAQFVSKEVMLQRLQNYIKAVFETISEQYPNLKIYTWDVVNEAVQNDGNGYRPAGTEANQDTSLWMKVIGEDFIEKAFEYAREYAPAGTQLAYNDYNEYMDAKTNMIYNICSDLADKGLIDVVGMQMHLSTDFPSVSMFEKAARKFATIPGVKLEITELDMTTQDHSTSGLEAQGKKYKAYFDSIKSLIKEGVNFDSITFWGVRDTDSWRASQYPCLFDKEYQAKPAFYGVVGDSVITTVPPVTTTGVPVVTPSKPAVTSSAPVVSPSKPAVTPSVPVVTPSNPAVTPSVPVQPSKEPVQGAPEVSVKTTVGSTINQTYNITPAAGSAVDTSKLTIRFYYTKDGAKDQKFWCDNAGIQMPEAPYYVAYTENVKGTFGDGYVELSFDKDYTFSSGALAIQVRINQSDWSGYTNLTCGDLEVYYDGVRVQ